MRVLLGVLALLSIVVGKQDDDHQEQQPLSSPPSQQQLSEPMELILPALLPVSPFYDVTSKCTADFETLCASSSQPEVRHPPRSRFAFLGAWTHKGAKNQAAASSSSSSNPHPPPLHHHGHHHSHHQHHPMMMSPPLGFGSWHADHCMRKHMESLSPVCREAVEALDASVPSSSSILPPPHLRGPLVDEPMPMPFPAIAIDPPMSMHLPAILSMPGVENEDSSATASSMENPLIDPMPSTLEATSSMASSSSSVARQASSSPPATSRLPIDSLPSPFLDLTQAKFQILENPPHLSNGVGGYTIERKFQMPHHPPPPPPPHMKMSYADPSYPAGGGGAPYDGDDETNDGVLALSLAGLLIWLMLSILIVTLFVKREKRRETMLRFWTAIDNNPDLKARVQAEAGGLSFPKPPKRVGLRRFLRATAVALAVTIGLNLVLFMARGPPPPGSAPGDADDGSQDVTPAGMDPSDDPSPSPLFGVVLLILIISALLLVAKGLRMVCCASRNGSNPTSASSTTTSSSHGRGGGYPGSSQAYEAVSTHDHLEPTSATPYVALHESTVVGGEEGGHHHYPHVYIGVPVSAPPADAIGIVEQHHQSPPPPAHADQPQIQAYAATATIV